MIQQKSENIVPRLVLIAVACVAAFLPPHAYCESGDLYETDLGTGTIIRFAPDGTKSIFASGLVAPVGLAFDGKGNVFVGDTGGGAVVKIAPDGTQSTFAAIPNGPTGLAFDASGNLFAAVFNTGDILKIAPDGTQTTFASGLTNATGLAFDGDGNLFAADFGGSAISKITAAGVKSTFASGLSTPGGLAFDRAGNLFATSNMGGMIYKFTADGTQSTFAVGGIGAAGIVFDRVGNLFVANNVDGTVSRFTPDGAKNTFASGLAQSTFLAFEPLPQKVVNASARAYVSTDENVLIVGFIVGGSSLLNNSIVLRAIGPSLSSSGVTNALLDPKLELRDWSGALIATNDNWQDTQKAQIQASHLAPTNAHESVILARLPAGSYTAIVRGVGDTTGVALAEIYNAP